MLRVFQGLAASTVLLIVVSAALGLGSSGPGAERHVLCAVLTLILICFVQVVVFTYFAVVGRTGAQAVHLGRLDQAPIAEMRKIKGANVRLVGLVVLGIVLTTSSGAIHWRSGGQGGIHFILASALFAVLVYVFFKQYELIFRASKQLRATLSDYEVSRQSRE